MAKPSPEEWLRLAKLNSHNAQQVAAMRADYAAGKRVKRGRALSISRSLAEAVRLEKNLKKRDGQR